MTQEWRYALILDDKTLELTGTDMVVGRSRTCDVKVSEPSVSRRHFRILRGHQSLIVQDLGSSNGTSVNDQPVHDRQPLRHGDRIGAGDIVFTVVLEPTMTPGANLDDTKPLEPSSADGVDRAAVHDAVASGPPSESLGRALDPAATPVEIRLPLRSPAAPAMATEPPPPPGPAPPVPSLEEAAPTAAVRPATSSTPAEVTASGGAPIETARPVESVPPPPGLSHAAPTPGGRSISSEIAFSPAPDLPAPAPPGSPGAAASQIFATRAIQIDDVLRNAEAPPPAPDAVPPAEVLTPVPEIDEGAQGRPPAPAARQASSAGSGFEDALDALSAETPAVPPVVVPAATPKPPPVPSPTRPRGAAQPAGFWIRVAAALADGLWIAGLAALIGFLLGVGAPMARQLTAAAVSWIGILIVIAGWSVWGTSPGKRLFKLYVCTADGEPGIGLLRAVVRMIGYLASLLPLGIGFFMAAAGDRRALHDRLAGTFVARFE